MFHEVVDIMRAATSASMIEPNRSAPYPATSFIIDPMFAAFEPGCKV